VHNLGHAAVSYLGFQYDSSLPYIWQVTEIPAVRAAAEAAMWESAHALIAAYPDEFTAANMGMHIADLLSRFTNRALGDTVFRVGRDLPRKLSREDRVIGAMLFDQAHGVGYTATARVAAAALKFRARDEGGALSAPDARFVAETYPGGIENIARTVCGLHLDVAAEAEIVAAISGC
jgi:mannitol-1-phosphate 5-dehydrogenase